MLTNERDNLTTPPVFRPKFALLIARPAAGASADFLPMSPPSWPRCQSQCGGAEEYAWRKRFLFTTALDGDTVEGQVELCDDSRRTELRRTHDGERVGEQWVATIENFHFVRQ